MVRNDLSAPCNTYYKRVGYQPSGVDRQNGTISIWMGFWTSLAAMIVGEAAATRKLAKQVRSAIN